MYVSTSYLWSIRVQTMESCCWFVFYNNIDSFWRPCLAKSRPQEREKQIASPSLFVKTTLSIRWFWTAHFSPRTTHNKMEALEKRSYSNITEIRSIKEKRRAPTATLLKLGRSKRKVKRFIGQFFLVCLWKYLICFQNFIISIYFHWIVNFSLLRTPEVLPTNAL